jgi:hypothetical protein
MRIMFGVRNIASIMPTEKKRFRPNHTRGEDDYVWKGHDEEVHESLAAARVHLRKTYVM